MYITYQLVELRPPKRMQELNASTITQVRETLSEGIHQIGVYGNFDFLM
jgi:hypothetical protein